LFGRRKKDVILIGGSVRPRRGSLGRRFRQLAAVIVATTVVLLAVFREQRETAKRNILIDLEEIEIASRNFRQDFGRCPHDLGELAHPPAGGIPYFSEDPNDPWGRQYNFRCPGRWNENRVDVASRGPDGEWLGGDDISTDL